MMDARQRAVVVPAPEIVIDRAAWRQILRQRGPLAASAQDIHQTIDDRPLIDGSLIAAPLGRGDQWFDQCPLLIRQVARVAQLAAIIPAAILGRPHRHLAIRCRR